MKVTKSYFTDLVYKGNDAAIDVHKAQSYIYMKLLMTPKGLLINFNVTNLYKQGQHTYVNDLYRDLDD